MRQTAKAVLMRGVLVFVLFSLAVSPHSYLAKVIVSGTAGSFTPVASEGNFGRVQGGDSQSGLKGAGLAPVSSGGPLPTQLSEGLPVPFLRGSPFQNPRLQAGSFSGACIDQVIETVGLVAGKFPNSLPTAVAYDGANGYVYVTSGFGGGTVMVINGATDSVIGSIPAGLEPDAVAYDSGNGYVYVANKYSGNLTVINGATNAAVGSIPVGNEPDAVAYDSGNDHLYVTSGTSSNSSGTVTVISGASNSITGSISVGVGPDAVAYDSGNGFLYVANYNSGNVTVINGATNSVVGSIPVGHEPDAVAYDNGNGNVYVANYYDDNVTVINGTTEAVVGSIPVGFGPDAVAFDGGNGYLYVVNFYFGPGGPGNVTVINGATNAVVGSIPVGEYSLGVAYDSGNEHVYVTNSWSMNVTVINGLTNSASGSIVLGLFPNAVAYDSGNGYLYVVSNLGNITILDGATGSVVGWIGAGGSSESPYDLPWDDLVALAYDVKNGNLYLTNGSSNVTVISGASNSIVGSIQVGGVARGVAYDSENGNVYVGGYPNVTVINGATDAVVGSISVGWYTSVVAYDSGNGNLYAAASFSNYPVTVINGATNTVVGSIGVGDWPSSIAYDSGNGHLYVANLNSNNVTVIDGATNSVLRSIPVGFMPDAVAYDNRNGYLYVANLDLGDAGSVTVIDGATDSVIGTIGAVPYGYGTLFSSLTSVAYDSGNGYLYMTSFGSGTVFVIIPITPSHVCYPMTFTETGLPARTAWSASLSGAWQYSTGSSIVYQEPNGTYEFTVGGAAGYSASPSSGSLTVNGSPVTVSITFAAPPPPPPTYEVTFTENGLPARTTWSIAFAGGTGWSTADSITFVEPNGTYRFTVFPVPGYSARPPSGSVTVAGASVTQLISFTVRPPTYDVTFTETGLPAGTPWSITVAGTTYTLLMRSVMFGEANGTYSFAVGSVVGYTVTPEYGNVTVAGRPIVESVTFTPNSPTPQGGQPGSSLLGVSIWAAYALMMAPVAIVVATVVALLIMRRRRGFLPPPPPANP